MSIILTLAFALTLGFDLIEFEVSLTSGLPANLVPVKPKYWLTCKVHLPGGTAVKLV